MAKQLNVNLAFTADVVKAKSQIQDLQKALDGVVKAPLQLGQGGNLTKTIQEASLAASQLQRHIQNAVNVDTGTLDFSKLDSSLKRSGVTLGDYAKKIAAIGPQGKQALATLATSVTQAEIPIKRTNKLLEEMATTLANTARWQISSSIMHGFMGAMSSAYGYAQDLNKSLNDIRIVTGYGVDQMARFAEQANVAAKNLSTTTTAYTDASLIFYQQGLSAEEVEKRTEITIKMANAAGQSAQVVSDQLTAVWNNFDNGTRSLEHYADVMTALGAATASSTDEIAQGLEKFAGIADTIGLSFEYATSALTTITSNSRQSADVVGTALKTIFARIEGLKLGETLEDGTTLNNYSKALEKVGINIFNSVGELKNMDSILDEIGAKWNTLNRDQQLALAQSVAGVRQYNQLVTLMDNWNSGDSDSMMANLRTANNAKGTLNEQAEIYAESWEAAQKRVQTALQGVYDSLIKDDFFIDALNGVEDLVTFVEKLIDSLGGLGGVLTTVGALLMKVFSDQLAQKVRDIAYNISMSTAYGREKERQKKEQSANEIGDILAAGEGGTGSKVGEEVANQYKIQRELQAELAMKQEEMSAEEIADAQQLLDIRKQIGEQIINSRKKEESGREQTDQGYMGALTTLSELALDSEEFAIDEDILNEFHEYRDNIKAAEEALVNLQDATTRYQKAQQNLAQVQNNTNASTEDIESAMEEAAQASNELRTAVMNVSQVTGEVGVTTQQAEKAFDQIVTGIDEAGMESEEAAKGIAALTGSLKEMSQQNQQGMRDSLSIDQADIDNMVQGYQTMAHANNENTQLTRQAEQAQQSYAERLKATKAELADWADRTVAFAQGMTSFVSVINSAKGAIDTLTNPDASGWEKFSSVMMSFGSIIMSVSMMVSSFKKAFAEANVVIGINTATELVNALAVKLNAAARKDKADATDDATKETTEDTAANMAHAASEVVDATATEANDAAKKNLKGSLKDLGGSFKNLASSAKSWISANSAAIAGTALIAAGVAVAVGAIAWGISQYNKYEKAAEEAAIQADKAAQAYQSVSDAYNQFTNNLSAYENARSGLEGLTEGTDEFKQAVLDANEAAMELLNTYEGLSYTTDENGLITINEESLKMAQEQELQKVQNAQQASMLADMNARKAETEAKSKQFQRDELHSSQGGWTGVGNAAAATAAGAGSGALIGAGIGMLGGPIGAGIGAAIGAALGGVVGIVGAATNGAAAKEEDEALQKLADVYAKEGNARFADDTAFKEMLSEQGITDPALVESLTANRESTMQLVAEMAENSAQISAMNEQMVSQQMGDKIKEQFKGENAEEMASAVTEAMGANLDEKSAALYEEKYKDKAGGMSDKDIQAQYAEAMGWDVSKTENKSGNKATYYDKDGNVVAEDLSDEVARQFLAQQEALTQLETSIPFYVEAVNSLANAGESLGEGIGTALASFAGGDGGNLGTLTQEQFAAVDSASLTAQKDEDGNIVSFTYNGEVIDDEKAKTLGYESAAAFYESFNAEIKRVEKAWKDINIDFEEAGLDPDIVGDLSLEAAQKFQKTLESMNYGALGDQGSKAFAEGINEITSSLNMGEADVASFIEQLGDVDWSSWDAMEDVNALLESMGYELDMTSEQMQNFITTMRQVGGASPVEALKSTWDNAALLYDTLKEGVPSGSILDAEKYEAIIAENGELEDSFVQMIDGTYKYVGDKELDMENVFDLGEQLKETKESNALYEGAKEAASNLDFEGLANLDYVSSADLKSARDAAKAAQDTLDAAVEEHSDGILGIKITNKEEQADLDTKTAAVDSANQNVENLKEQQKKDQEKAQAMVQSIKDNEYLTKIAEKHGWTDETLQAMIEGIGNGDDASMEQMKTIASQMNTFMAAGDEGLYDIGAAEEKIASMATSVSELDQLTAKYSLSQETYAKAITGLFATAASEAQSLEELNNLMAKVENSGATVDYEIYANNLIRLGEAYSNCGEEIEAFQMALQSGDQEVIEAAQNQLEASVMLGEAAEQYGFSAEEMEIQSKQLAKAYNLDAKAAAKLAIENQRMNKGVENLVNNWGDWKKELKGSDKTSRDWAKAAAECTKTIADLVGASEDLELPADFFDSAKNMELLDRAAKGSADAINELGVVVAAAQIKMLEFSQGMQDASGNLIDQTQFDTWKNTILSGITDLQNGLSNLKVGDNIYEQLGGDDWVNALNQMAVATHMSVEEMNSLLNSMGVQAKVDVIDVPQKMKVPTYTEVQEPNEVTVYGTDAAGNEIKETRHGWTKYTVPGPSKEVDGVVQVAQISTEGGDTPAPKITFTGNGNVSNSARTGGKGGGGGGGGSKKEPKKAEKKKKSEVVERYKEVEDALDDLKDTFEDVNKSVDRLYGASRITQMQRTNDLLQSEIKLLQQKKKEAQAYLALDKKELNSKASAAGVSFSYDANGNISNYDAQMTKLYNQLDGAIEAANRDGDASEEEQKKIDEIQKKIDELKDAISQYDETRELIEDLDNELDDKFYEWQDNNAEQINYKFEIEMELKDDELQLAEYYMDKISDDFYKRAEGIAFLNKQMDVQTSRLGDYEIYMDELKRAYAEGEISQAAYIEGLNEITDGALSNAAALQELDKQMMAYYGETLTAASEELDKFTERMEHQQSVLEHYLTIMDLMGESTNYAKVGEVLVAQGDMLKDQMETTKQEYLMYAQEADENYLAWMSAENEEEAELYKQRYEDSLALASEAQEEYLSLAESYGEKLREILDNSLSQYAQDLENALTGGTSFDQMSTRWERAALLQEEYLTNTNKIYETTKLMNQAQKQIDKSTSSVAKERLKQFINETNQLQKKGKLSQFELEIQQAKYELLLAELALEDARDAKQQVRLSRDAEGNFGYIYTANAEEVSDAEEKFLEAQNNLYNTALEGANDYAQKYQQTLNEMYDELVDLQQQYLDGAFETEEEYQNAVLETKQYYYSLLEDYSDLYTVAVSADARVLEDAWTTEFNSMIYNTENWKVEVEKYVGQVGKAFDQWESDMDRLASDVGIGGDLENLTEKVSEVTTEHEKLTDLVNSKVLPALKSEIVEVRNLTTEYAKLRKVQLEAIKGFEQVAEKAQEDKKKEVKDEKPKNVAPSATPPTTPSKPKSPQGDGKLNVGDVVTFTGQYYNDSYGTRPTGDVFSGQKNAVKITKIVSNPKTKNGQNYYIHIGNAKSGQGYTQLGWVKKEQLTGYDTGGYTGKWGSYGKLAMLHEKELVLNKKDTQNLLETITLMRDINKMIDMQAAMMQMDNIMKSPGYLTKKNMLQQEALEQKVSIEANFPNVASHFEIEEAFMNLVNQASQYANRK